MRNKKYLILGATGSIGFAFTNELLSRGIKVSILVRNKKKAEDLFKNNALLEVIEGDVTNLEKLKAVSSDKDVIFHGINYPYNLWEQFMMPITKNVIDAAKQNKATILFPGNIYSFGNVTTKITEESIARPSTKKGALRLALIKLLKEATHDEACNVIVLRLPDFFGPNVTNGLIKPIFGNAAKKKSIEWIINADVAHQFVYTKDAARLFYMLSEEETLPTYYLLNFEGETVPSIREWSKTISQIAGSPNKVKVTSKTILGVLSLFVPVIKELKENYYQFENTILLDGSKLKSLYPTFCPSKMEDSIAETITWFKENSN